MICPKCEAPTYYKDGTEHCMLCWWEEAIEEEEGDDG